ncbi:hypothetical protein [Streptomyces abikoensis]|uniref:Uncharacterized protein n=1 Tax=Streptomyces abikoensis TaxID=97398 RepID=A0ABW7SZW9_9ACTN
MPDTKHKNPKQTRTPDRTDNLLHGGSRELTCPKCHTFRNKKVGGQLIHGIPELPDSPKLREAVGRVRDALQAAPPADMGDDKNAFMVGVLEARVSGKDYCLVASSGRPKSWVEKRHLSNISYRQGSWEIVHPRIPEADQKDRKWDIDWKTVAGEKINIPIPQGRDQAGRKAVDRINAPCAAMKLLLGLREKVAQQGKWGRVEYVRMSEQVYVRNGVKVPENMRKYQGKGKDGSYSGTWTAQSCDACTLRIPYLICDVPDNLLPG